MKYTVTKADFIQVLVDRKGYSREEAEDLSKEYRNDLGSWISDIGGDEHSLEEAKAFLSPITLRKGTDKATGVYNTSLVLD